MPTPNNIEIKFTASGNAIDVIEKLSKAQGALTKVNQKFAKSQKTVNASSKQLSDSIELNKIEFEKYNRTLNLNSKTLKKLGISNETIEKAQKGNAKALGLVRRAYGMKNKAVAESIAVDKQLEAQSKKQEAQFEKQIQAQKKAEEAAKKLAKAQQHLAVNSKINRDNIAKLNKKLKGLGVSWKDAAVKGGLLRDALRGNAAAMSTVNRAATHLIKKNKKLGFSLFSLSNDGRLVTGSFATMRSKLLLEMQLTLYFLL